jgi:integrase
MASLQASHSRRCALSAGRKSPAVTPFAIPADCTCQPSYFVDSLVNGKKVRERVGKNRKQAERRLNKVNVAQDEGSYEPPRDLPFPEFADKWHAGLQRPKKTTADGYLTTINYAKLAFAQRKVRQVTADDVGRFLDLIPAGETTKAKHLRVLSSLFSAAVKWGYAGRNPVDRLPDSHRPKPKRSKASYFMDDELPMILAQLDGMYRVAFLLSLKTGIREGELAALTWPDVSLTEREITVWKATSEDGTPKTESSCRVVDFNEDVEKLLAAWWAECGKPTGDVLVFATGSGPIPFWTFTKGILYPALKRAGIERVGPYGKKRTWHSLRHTYARLWIEGGGNVYALSAQLGHSSVRVTTDRYGHFSRKASKLEAEKVKSPI